MPKATAVTCTLCARSALLPENRNHSGLWDEGWRWLGSANLFSCPDCPPMVEVDEQGYHRRGPGAELARRAA